MTIKDYETEETVHRTLRSDKTNMQKAHVFYRIGNEYRLEAIKENQARLDAIAKKEEKRKILKEEADAYLNQLEGELSHEDRQMVLEKLASSLLEAKKLQGEDNE